VDKLLLAIDTATRIASMALHDGARVRVELTWETASHHTTELVPRIAGMLAQINASMSDLSGVAVSLGPGSFTGVRVGVAAAKGICLALDLPIYGVRTLDVIARAQPPVNPRGASKKSVDYWPLVAVIQAGRKRLCAARYSWTASGWQIEGEPWLTTVKTMGEDWEGTTLVCGELEAGERHSLQTRLGKRVWLAAPAACLRRAGYLAEIGWERLGRKQADDPATVVPIYIQTPGGLPA